MTLAQDLTDPNKMINSIVLLVVGLAVLAGLLPTLFISFGNLSTVTGLGIFGAFFSTGGIIGVIVGAAIFIGVLGAIGIGRLKRK